MRSLCIRCLRNKIKEALGSLQASCMQHSWLLCIYIERVPFSALKHTHCTHVACDSKWVTVAFHSILEYSLKWCNTALSGFYMADANWNCCHLGACSVYTIQPCTSLQCQLFEATYIQGVLFSCNLPPAFWAKWPGSFLHATVVTQGWNRYQNTSQHRKLTLKEKILLPFLWRLKHTTFQPQLWHSTTGAPIKAQICIPYALELKRTH